MTPDLPTAADDTDSLLTCTACSGHFVTRPLVIDEGCHVFHRQVSAHGDILCNKFRKIDRHQSEFRNRQYIYNI